MSDDTDTAERIIEALENRDVIVMGAGDVAEQVGVHRTTALDYLRDLEDEGRVASIQIGANAVGWYLPTDWPPGYLIPTYHDYVRRPIDDRGRVTIGAEYAHKTLTLAILESPAQRTVTPDEWEYESPMRYHRAAAIFTDTADERGRVKPGSDWAAREVSIAVLEVSDE